MMTTPTTHLRIAMRWRRRRDLNRESLSSFVGSSDLAFIFLFRLCLFLYCFRYEG